MYPILIEFGFLNLKIFTYGLMVASGFFSGILLAAHWAKQDGLDQQRILDLCFYIALAALLGGRALYIIVEYRYFLSNPIEVLKFWKGGLVFYGGLIGAVSVAPFLCANATSRGYSSEQEKIRSGSPIRR